MRNSNKSGFTLLELVIATGVLAVIMLIALSFASTMLSGSESQFTKVSLQEKMDRAIASIVRQYQESNGSMAYAYEYSNPVKSVSIFPTPRKQNGQFAAYETNYQGEITSIATSPQWQGWVILYIYQGKLVMLTDHREGHTFGKAPSIVYPDDLTNDSEPYLYYYDGTKDSDGNLIEWEFPKDPSKIHEYSNMKVTILAQDITCFRVTLTGGRLSLYLTGYRGTGGDRGITVTYNDSTSARNNN